MPPTSLLGICAILSLWTTSALEIKITRSLSFAEDDEKADEKADEKSGEKADEKTDDKDDEKADDKDEKAEKTDDRAVGDGAGNDDFDPEESATKREKRVKLAQRRIRMAALEADIDSENELEKDREAAEAIIMNYDQTGARATRGNDAKLTLREFREIFGDAKGHIIAVEDALNRADLNRDDKINLNELLHWLVGMQAAPVENTALEVKALAERGAENPQVRALHVVSEEDRKKVALSCMAKYDDDKDGQLNRLEIPVMYRELAPGPGWTTENRVTAQLDFSWDLFTEKSIDGEWSVNINGIHAMLSEARKWQTMRYSKNEQFRDWACGELGVCDGVLAELPVGSSPTQSEDDVLAKFLELHYEPIRKQHNTALKMRKTEDQIEEVKKERLLKWERREEYEEMLAEGKIKPPPPPEPASVSSR